MAEMAAMASDAARLKAFLKGDSWSNKYARLSLPILVRWAEEEKANAPAALIERTYKDLAIAVDQPRHAHPIHEALGVLGFALRELKTVKPRMFESERHKDGQEIEVSLDEVRLLGEKDADFRRSIVTSTETLNTIVDASIRELDRLRSATGEQRLKIIASALNYEHCGQIVAAYEARGRRAGYVHSREEGTANERVMQKLKNHELDVIVQVRKLGEGFDHPLLAVAAVFSVFGNLSPFVQFVGRIMRVIEHDAPGHPLNNGVVVFHAGANIARRWEDFQQYSEADREYFDQLLPMEDLDFTNAQELEINPVQSITRHVNSVDVRAQTDIRIQEISLIKDDPDAIAALLMLKTKGYTPDQVKEAFEKLEPVPVTKVRQRKAKRALLDMRIKTEAARILHEQKINPEGRTLDRQRLGRTNLIVLKAAIDRQANAAVGRTAGERSEFSKPQLDQIEAEFSAILDRAVQEVFNGSR